MDIRPHEVTIRELTDGYVDSEEGGVVGYGGRLNIRPAFQREFIYDTEQQRDVIKSIMHGYPLNVMYWIDKGDDTYEMLDGQQRTLSICKYVCEALTVDNLGYKNLTGDRQAQILDYRLMVYVCNGEDSEILNWFEVINIAGEKLTEQERRNAVYSGHWLTDAKRHFSKNNCEAYTIAQDYMKGAPIRQEYLETAIRWIADREGIRGKQCVRDYMARHQHDQNSNDLWLYFQAVMNWTKVLFPAPTKYAKGVEWGKFYNRYHAKHYDASELQARAAELMKDDDITRLAGVYEYLIDGDEKHLNIRAFKEKDKTAAYERQKGICAHCGGHFALSEMEADHIIPWSKGGHTVPENCQMLCKNCNRKKGSK